MIKENIKSFQQVKWHLVLPALLLGLLSGCAEEDQVEKDINSPSVGLVRLGDQMHAEGEDQGAMEFYARAAQNDPGNASVHEKLAALLAAHNDAKDAAEQYRILATLAPGNADYHRSYGRALIMLNQPGDAKAQYQAALAIDSTDTRTLNGLGIADDLVGDHAAAQDQYKAALQEKPDDLVTLNNLGHSYILGGSYEAAISLLEPQYENPATPAEMRENLAEAYGMAGMYIDAERVLKKDLPPDQVKKKLAHFRSLRAKDAVPMAYANLGSFATADLAGGHLDKIKEQFAADIGMLSLEVVPEVDEQGGTPIFSVRASGFRTITAARDFCNKLKKGDVFCKEHEG